MIAIRDRSLVRIGANQVSATQLFGLMQAGSDHFHPSVSRLFLKARQLASNAVSENAETSLVVSALLFYPCQALATGVLTAGNWTSDSLLKTGTYDWLEENFGEEVAETIRLQPYAKRFLATVVPRYFSKLDSECQQGVFLEGGFMTSFETTAFSEHRCHFNSMKIARWLDQGVNRCLEVPEMDFFKPFIERALDSIHGGVARSI